MDADYTIWQKGRSTAHVKFDSNPAVADFFCDTKLQVNVDSRSSDRVPRTARFSNPAEK